MDEELNVAANDTEELATPSIEESTSQVDEPQDNIETEVITEPTQPVKQDVTQTQVFAQRLKEEKTKAQDEMIANMYGESHGIYTKVDYDNAVKQAERDSQIQAESEKQGVSEDLIRRLRDLEDSNNSTKAEKEQYQKQLAMITEHETLSKDATFKDYYSEHVDEIKESAKNFNVDLTTAMLLSIKDNFKSISSKAEQKAINSIIKNGKSSTGSLNAGGEQRSESIYDLSNADFKKMQNEVMNGTRKNMN